MKTVIKALTDEILYPIPVGYVENVLLCRGIDDDEEFTADTAKSAAYRGALADCLCCLVQSINFSEADKSIGALTDEQRKLIAKRANRLYADIGEPEIESGEAQVFIGG